MLDAETQLRQTLQDAGLPGWAERVGATGHSEFPVELIDECEAGQHDGSLAKRPFDGAFAPDETAWLPRPPPQPTRPEGPKSWRDLYTVEALAQIDGFARDTDRALREFDSGAVRVKHPKAVALGQDAIRPEYRGVVWDCRGDRPRVADFHEHIETHLNLDYLREALSDYPDQELLSFLVLGVRSKTDDMPLQTVLLPHLVSLEQGHFPPVDEQVRGAVDKGWCTRASGPAFVPFRLHPKGSAPKKGTTERRPTTNLSAPHKELRDTEGACVTPYNVLADTKNRRCPGPARFPREVKPRVSTCAGNTAVLRALARELGQPVFSFVDDLRWMFQQFQLAPAERWKVQLVWRDWDSQGPCFLAENVMGYGGSPFSNVAQRFSHALMYLLRQRFDAEDVAYDTPQVAALRQRRLGIRGSRDDCRLYAADAYTDDFKFDVIGAERAARLLQLWGTLCEDIGVVRAEARKRLAGASVTWLGILHYPMLGAVAVPEDKRLRALQRLRRLDDGGKVTYREYQELLGLLVHLMFFAGVDRDEMYGMHDVTSVGLGPTDPVPRDAVAQQRDTIRTWIDVLTANRGVPMTAAFEPRSMPAEGAVPRFTIWTDAAKDGARVPGLGGYCGGYCFALALPQKDVTGDRQISIPVLEFVGIVAGLLTFYPHVQGSPVATLSDSITSVMAMQNLSASSRLMRLVHTFLLQQPEFTSLADAGLELGHCRGGLNVMADALSRGNNDTLSMLGRQLGVRLRHLDVDPRIRPLLERVRQAARDDDAGADATSSDDEGGPSPEDTAERRPDASRGAPKEDGPEDPDHVSLDASSLGVPQEDNLCGDGPPQNFLKRQARKPRTLAKPRMVAGRRPTPPAAAKRTPAGAASDGPRRPKERVSAEDIQEIMTAGPSDLHLRCDPEKVRDLYQAVRSAARAAAPKTTARTNSSAWKSWVAWCRRMGADPWRNDRDSNTGRDHAGREKETLLLAGFVLNSYMEMAPGPGRKVPKPQSAMNRAYAVRRVHATENIEMVDLKFVNRVLRGMTVRFVEEHGPEALAPQHREPFTREDLTNLFAVPEGTKVSGFSPVSWTDPLWAATRARHALQSETGFRVSEVAGPFTTSALKRANLRWRFRGRIYESLTEEQLRALDEGDAAIIRPPPAKNDTFGAHFGGHPIWLRYDPSVSHNAAWRLAQYELVAPCTGDRKEWPLFARDGRALAFSQDHAQKLLRGLLLSFKSNAEAQRYSVHSFRVYYACALLAAGYSLWEIQAFARWKTASSAKLYARLNPEDYMRSGDRAAQADVSSFTSKSLFDRLPTIDADGHVRELREFLDAGPRPGEQNAPEEEPSEDERAD